MKIHDFRMIHKGQILQFDVVVPEGTRLSDEELERMMRIQIEKRVGEYHLDITFDHNYLLF